MGLPVIQEIFDGLRWLIDFFFNKAPKPVAFLFFLILLFIFTTFISFTLHLFGVHCTSTGDAVKVSLLKFGTNIELAFIGANEPLNESSYTPQPITVGTGVIALIGREVCFRTICFHEGEYFWKEQSECDNETIIYPYKSRTWDYWQCAVCNGTVNETFIRGQFGSSETVDLCFGNALPLDPDSMNFYQRNFCDPSSQCAVPRNYYYDYAINKYVCTDEDICGENNTNSTTIITKADQLLEGADAELMYSPTIADRDIRRAVTFRCDKEGSPYLTFFQIPVFDYRVWLLIVVIYTMLIMLSHITQQSR
jgi:hypothetical protein